MAVTGPAPARLRLYRCGTCGSAVTTTSRCPGCQPRLGVAIVGCFDCRRCRTFASDVAPEVAHKHVRATAHRTWVVLEQTLMTRGQTVPKS